MTGRIEIQEWIANFDNWDIDHDQRIHELEESVKTYNFQFDTFYSPRKEVIEYLSKMRNKGTS